MSYNIIIIDGTNYFIRYFSADKSVDTFGHLCGGISGFLRGLKNLIKEFTPSEIVIVFDGKDNSKRKQKIDDQYKKGRKMSYVDIEPQKNEELFKKQLSKLNNILTYLPIKVVTMNNVEADDSIGYIAHLYKKIDEDFNLIIVSRDADFYQLISKSINVYDPFKKKIIDVEEFKKQYNFLPYNFHIYKLFTGERKSGDNIKRIWNKKTILNHLEPILQSEQIYFYTELEEYLKKKKTENADKKLDELDMVQVQTNYDLVCLHEPNMSLDTKSKIGDIIKKFNKKPYGLLGLKIQLKIFGIDSHIYDDFFSHMNLYKMKNNKLTTYIEQLIAE